jgi:hypothetical protein
MIATDKDYNVVCMSCGQVFTPGAKTPLWWLAKQHADAGHLDVPHIPGERCGCVERRYRPNAPFRVFGYNDLCEDLDIPFDTFMAAVKKYRELRNKGMYVVFISGVSEAVRVKLELG